MEGDYVFCEHEFEPELEDELHILPGTIIKIVENVASPEDQDLWTTGFNLLTEETGMFPSHGYCRPATAAEVDAARTKDSQKLQPTTLNGTVAQQEEEEVAVQTSRQPHSLHLGENGDRDSNRASTYSESRRSSVVSMGDPAPPTAFMASYPSSQHQLAQATAMQAHQGELPVTPAPSSVSHAHNLLQDAVQMDGASRSLANVFLPPPPLELLESQEDPSVPEHERVGSGDIAMRVGGDSEYIQVHAANDESENSARPSSTQSNTTEEEVKAMSSAPTVSLHDITLREAKSTSPASEDANAAYRADSSYMSSDRPVSSEISASSPLAQTKGRAYDASSLLAAHGHTDVHAHDLAPTPQQGVQQPPPPPPSDFDQDDGTSDTLIAPVPAKPAEHGADEAAVVLRRRSSKKPTQATWDDDGDGDDADGEMQGASQRADEYLTISSKVEGASDDSDGSVHDDDDDDDVNKRHSALSEIQIPPPPAEFSSPMSSIASPPSAILPRSFAPHTIDLTTPLHHLGNGTSSREGGSFLSPIAPFNQAQQSTPRQQQQQQQIDSFMSDVDDDDDDADEEEDAGDVFTSSDESDDGGDGDGATHAGSKGRRAKASASGKRGAKSHRKADGLGTMPGDPRESQDLFTADASRSSPNKSSDSLLPLREAARSHERRKALRNLNLEGRKVILHKGDGGYGFSINGESPVFVRSVDKGGPCDNGYDGLLEGDIILKVNDIPCPLGPRQRVVELIKATVDGAPLVLVVCRTPRSGRRRFSSSSSSQSSRAATPLSSSQRSPSDLYNSTSLGDVLKQRAVGVENSTPSSERTHSDRPSSMLQQQLASSRPLLIDPALATATSSQNSMVDANASLAADLYNRPIPREGQSPESGKERVPNTTTALLQGTEATSARLGFLLPPATEPSIFRDAPVPPPQIPTIALQPSTTGATDEDGDEWATPSSITQGHHYGSGSGRDDDDDDDDDDDGGAAVQLRRSAKPRAAKPLFDFTDASDVRIAQNTRASRMVPQHTVIMSQQPPQAADGSVRPSRNKTSRWRFPFRRKQTAAFERQHGVQQGEPGQNTASKGSAARNEDGAHYKMSLNALAMNGQALKYQRKIKVEDIKAPTKKGVVLKQCLYGSLAVFRPRYFVLFGSSLAYFKSTAPKTESSAVVDLCGCSIDKKQWKRGRAVFVIKSRNWKPITLKSSEEKARAWVDAITAARDQFTIRIGQFGSLPEAQRHSTFIGNENVTSSNATNGVAPRALLDQKEQSQSLVAPTSTTESTVPRTPQTATATASMMAQEAPANAALSALALQREDQSRGLGVGNLSDSTSTAQDESMSAEEEFSSTLALLQNIKAQHQPSGDMANLHDEASNTCLTGTGGPTADKMESHPQSGPGSSTGDNTTTSCSTACTPTTTTATTGVNRPQILDKQLPRGPSNRDSDIFTHVTASGRHISISRPTALVSASTGVAVTGDSSSKGQSSQEPRVVPTIATPSKASAATTNRKPASRGVIKIDMLNGGLDGNTSTTTDPVDVPPLADGSSTRGESTMLTFHTGKTGEHLTPTNGIKGARQSAPRLRIQHVHNPGLGSNSSSPQKAALLSSSAVDAGIIISAGHDTNRYDQEQATSRYQHGDQRDGEASSPQLNATRFERSSFDSSGRSVLRLDGTLRMADESSTDDDASVLPGMVVGETPSRPESMTFPEFDAIMQLNSEI